VGRWRCRSVPVNISKGYWRLPGNIINTNRGSICFGVLSSKNKTRTSSEQSFCENIILRISIISPGKSHSKTTTKVQIHLSDIRYHARVSGNGSEYSTVAVYSTTNIWQRTDALKSTRQQTEIWNGFTNARSVCND